MSHVRILLVCLYALCGVAQADPTFKVFDIATRPGVTVRISALIPEQPRAAVILFAGGDGGVQIFPNGSVGRLTGNFLVRSQHLFPQHDVAAILMGVPSDRARPPYLSQFRQSPEHAEDVRQVILWARQAASPKVWLVGTSRGTESAATAGLKLQGMDGLRGIVLTSSVLVDPRATAVPALQLNALQLPILVVHHEKDSCVVTRYADLELLVKRLPSNIPSRVITVTGGNSQGSECEGLSHHGFNGREADVIRDISDWIQSQ